MPSLLADPREREREREREIYFFFFFKIFVDVLINRSLLAEYS